MAKKPYDVAARFQEVAKRAREINTAPKTTPKPEKSSFTGKEYDTTAYPTRPGRVKGPNSGKDVNLPLSSAPSFMKKKK